MESKVELQQVISQAFYGCKKKMDIIVKGNFMFSLEKLGFPGGRIDITIYNDLEISDKNISEVLTTIDKYKSLKNSKYYNEFKEWNEDVQDDFISCYATTVKGDVPSFLAELLNNLGYSVSDLEIKENKGCLGSFALLVIGGITTSLLLF